MNTMRASEENMMGNICQSYDHYSGNWDLKKYNIRWHSFRNTNTFRKKNRCVSNYT